jgi:uncharacterized protein (DUF305 family)
MRDYMLHKALLAFILVIAVPASVMAQTPAVSAGAAAREYSEANAIMHKDMAIAYSENADVDFVRGMIPHHQGAIDMARVVQKHGKDAEVKKLAAGIIRDQERDIARMLDWLKRPANALTAMVENHDHGSGHPAPAGAAGKGFSAANAKMHKDMDITFSNDADVDFVRGMIPHHQGAIDMAKVVQEHGKDPDVKKLAAEIIAAQEKEIAWMQGWLKKRGGR